MDDATATTLARRPGRRRDETKDEAILTAARDLLAERGYEGMTMDAVADRAGAGKATLYRRWPSKVQLTVDAIVFGRGVPAGIDDVPDTGSLRGDLRSVKLSHHRDRDNALMSGLMSVVRENPEVARVFQEQFIGSRVALMRGLLERARQRGELRPDVDLDIVATVAPAMIAYRKIVVGQDVDDAFIERVIHSVILPMVGAPGPTPPHPPAI